MKIYIYFIFIYTVLFQSNTYAHPTSFEGSKGLMGYHSPALSHSQISYSHKYWFASGVHHIRRPDLKNKSASFASTNFLLKRWNGSDLQANLYAVLGVGNSELISTSETSGLGLIQFDIEDRDYYFLAKHSRIFNSERTDLEQSIVRTGFTPYVGDFEDIHSWLILEFEHIQFYSERNLSDITPFLRVFYRNLLFEIGQSFEGTTKFNYITHF